MVVFRIFKHNYNKIYTAPILFCAAFLFTTSSFAATVTPTVPNINDILNDNVPTVQTIVVNQYITVTPTITPTQTSQPTTTKTTDEKLVITTPYNGQAITNEDFIVSGKATSGTIIKITIKDEDEQKFLYNHQANVITNGTTTSDRNNSWVFVPQERLELGYFSVTASYSDPVKGAFETDKIYFTIVDKSGNTNSLNLFRILVPVCIFIIAFAGGFFFWYRKRKNGGFAKTAPKKEFSYFSSNVRKFAKDFDKDPDDPGFQTETEHAAAEVFGTRHRPVVESEATDERAIAPVSTPINETNPESSKGRFERDLHDYAKENYFSSPVKQGSDGKFLAQNMYMTNNYYGAKDPNEDPSKNEIEEIKEVQKDLIESLKTVTSTLKELKTDKKKTVKRKKKSKE